LQQHFRGSPADAGGRPGDDDGFHDFRFPSSHLYLGIARRARKWGRIAVNASFFRLNYPRRRKRTLSVRFFMYFYGVAALTGA
jgi:hypothetical protein